MEGLGRASTILPYEPSTSSLLLGQLGPLVRQDLLGQVLGHRRGGGIRLSGRWGLHHLSFTRVVSTFVLGDGGGLVFFTE